MNRIKPWLLTLRSYYRRLPAAIRSGWVTGWVTFTGTLLTLATGLLPALATAITTRNFGPFLDSLAVSTSAAFSAALGFIAGAVNTLYRFWRPVEKAYVTDEAITAKVYELNHLDTRPPRL